MTKCKNCQNLFAGNYCNQCGQPAETTRINAEFLWEDIQHGILHYDKGMGYSLKRLFSRPGYEISDYIKGKRVGHFRPLSMVIIMATLYALLYHYLDLNNRSAIDESSGLVLEKIFEHFYWFVVATVPIYAISTLIFFKKSGYNFYELVIFEAFKTSQRLTVHVIFLPLMFFLKDGFGFNILTNLLIIIDFILLLWTNFQFFNKFSRKEVLLRSVLSFILYWILAFIFLGLIILALGIR